MPISKRNRSIRKTKSKKYRKASNPKRTRRKSRRVKRSRKMRGGAGMQMTPYVAPPAGVEEGEAGQTHAAPAGQGIPAAPPPPTFLTPIKEQPSAQPQPEPEPEPEPLSRATSKFRIPTGWHERSVLPVIKLTDDIVYTDSEGKRSIEIEIGTMRTGLVIGQEGIRKSSQRNQRPCFAFTVPLDEQDKIDDDILVTLPETVYTPQLDTILNDPKSVTVVTPNMMWSQKNNRRRPLDPARSRVAHTQFASAHRSLQPVVPSGLATMTARSPMGAALTPAALGSGQGTLGTASSSLALQGEPLNADDLPTAETVARNARRNRPTLMVARPDERGFFNKNLNPFSSPPEEGEWGETVEQQSTRLLLGDGGEDAGEEARCAEIQQRIVVLHEMMDGLAFAAHKDGIAIQDLLEKHPDIKKMWEEFAAELNTLADEKREYEVRAKARLDCLDGIRNRLDVIIEKHEQQWRKLPNPNAQSSAPVRESRARAASTDVPPAADPRTPSGEGGEDNPLYSPREALLAPRAALRAPIPAATGEAGEQRLDALLSRPKQPSAFIAPPPGDADEGGTLPAVGSPTGIGSGRGGFQPVGTEAMGEAMEMEAL